MLHAPSPANNAAPIGSPNTHNSNAHKEKLSEVNLDQTNLRREVIE